MATGDGVPPLREDETQQNTGQLLQPYPQAFESDAQTVYYVNTGANYRYLSQLVVTFDENGDVTEIGDESGAFATDLAGVQRLFGDAVESVEDFAEVADPGIVEIVEGIGDFIRTLDGTVFGQSDVFLNGIRGFVRTEETNLGNLTQDATRWYVQQYLDAAGGPAATVAPPPTVHVSFGNGGGIRDFIGTSLVPGGGGDLVQGPTAPNPEVGKEEGDVSALDIANSLRFDNDLVVGTITAADLLALVEHGVSADATEGRLLEAGRFGQWSGLTFAFDATLPAGDRVIDLAIVDEDGATVDVIVENGDLVGDAGRTFGIATAGFLANGGDSYPTLIQNLVSLVDLAATIDPDTLGRADLVEGRQQDALAEYLAAFFDAENGQAAFAEADTPAAEDARIVQLALGDATPDFTPIYEIQGYSQVSPLVLDEVGSATAASFFRAIRDGLDFPNGQATRDEAGRLFNIEGPEVTTVGVVTAIDRDSQGRAQGFYLQDATGDGDIATSDAILVFTGRGGFPADLAIGDELAVSGQIVERFGGDTASRQRPVTQITVSDPAAIETLSTGNALPEAAVIGAAGRIVPDRNIEDDRFIAFDPETSALDFFESLEGMRITIADALAVSGLTRNDTFWVVADQGADATTLSSRDALIVTEGDFNPEGIRVQLPSRDGAPRIDTGDLFGDLTGVLGFAFGQDQLVPTEDPFASYVDGGLEAGVTTLQGDDQTMTVATYNVLNLDPNDGDGDTDVRDFRFLRLALDIVENLGTPDVIALQEVQDNSGTLNDGVTSADETLQLLADAIDFVDNGRRDGSLVYGFVDTPDVADGRGGGQPGGNIRNAYLYNTARVDLIEDSVATIGTQDAGQPNFASRLPLIADFAFGGETVTLINVHNSAKTGSAPLLGIDQPFDARQEDPTINSRVDQRAEQMALVGDFVQRALRADPDANVVALGDFNEFQFVSPVRGLEAAGLTDLGNLLPDEERYSFIFNGNAQQIDHILVSDSLVEGAGYEIVHTNVEFFEDEFRGSDHDPVLAALRLGGDAIA
jgi:predicted extracellular nuclease